MYTYLLAILLTPLFLFAETPTSPLLVYDMQNEPALPPKFRAMDDPLPASASQEGVNLAGLSELRASGSGQFSELSFKTLLNKLKHPPKLLIVDLRDESHGFINGSAISWYADRNWGNKELSPAEAAADEKKRLGEIKPGSTVTISQILKKSNDGALLESAPNYVLVDRVQSEEELVTGFGASYLRLWNVDHSAPDPDEVEKFIALVRSLPKETWIHFHCRGGVGRTTLYLAMLDILKNGKKVSFNDIVKRQYLLGGKDLTALDEEGWKTPYFKERLIFLQNFYNKVVE